MSAPDGRTQIPTGPIDEPLHGVLPRDAAGHILPGARRDALRAAVRGVELGACDKGLIDHLADLCDGPMVVGLCSLMERVRAAGAAETTGRNTP